MKECKVCGSSATACVAANDADGGELPEVQLWVCDRHANMIAGMVKPYIDGSGYSVIVRRTDVSENSPPGSE